MIRQLHVRLHEPLALVPRTHVLVERSAVITGRFKIIGITARQLFQSCGFGAAYTTRFMVEGLGLSRQLIICNDPNNPALDAEDGGFPGAGLEVCGSLALVLTTTGTRTQDTKHTAIAQMTVEQY